MSTLGKKVKDKATGFIGIVTAEATYLFKPTLSVLVEAESVDNKVPSSDWFDESRLEVIEEEATETAAAETADTVADTPPAATEDAAPKDETAATADPAQNAGDTES